MQVKKQQLEPDMEQWTGSKLGRSTSRLYIVTFLFNVYAEDIIGNAGLGEAQAAIKIAGRISITSDMLMTPPLWQKVKRN